MFLDKSQLMDSCKTVIRSMGQLEKPSTFAIATVMSETKTSTRLADCTQAVIGARKIKGIQTLTRMIAPNEGAVVGELLDTFAGAANFDWSCNPAASEGQTIACEMLRKQVGLNESYSISGGGLEMGSWAGFGK